VKPSKNEELRDAADRLLQKCSLPELLTDYSSWFIGGSYNYGLMCWRDLDVYVLDTQHDLRKCFEIGYELTRLLSRPNRDSRTMLAPTLTDFIGALNWVTSARAHGKSICGFWMRQVMRSIQNTVTISGYV
jgi:hypothetical protein